MTNATEVTPGQTATITWNIDPTHSVAEFKVKHMMIANVKGQFSKVSGALTLDELAGRTDPDLLACAAECLLFSSLCGCPSMIVGDNKRFPL